MSTLVLLFVIAVITLLVKKRKIPDFKQYLILGIFSIILVFLVLFPIKTKIYYIKRNNFDIIRKPRLLKVIYEDTVLDYWGDYYNTISGYRFQLKVQENISYTGLVVGSSIDLVIKDTKIIDTNK